MDQSHLSLITTGDGSHSLLNSQLNETYHSHHGAVQESLHVFIEKGLRYFLDQNKVRQVRIFEVGFGTGLNALLALEFSKSHPDHLFQYKTIEAFPLTRDLWSQLNYISAGSFFHQLHEVEWEKENAVAPNFLLTKYRATLQQLSLMETFDVIFFDAFAPNKQPEMWEMPMLEKVTALMKAGSVFVTYCAKGQLKRDLKALGLSLETLAGPPGKKEMVRALKI